MAEPHSVVWTHQFVYPLLHQWTAVLLWTHVYVCLFVFWYMPFKSGLNRPQWPAGRVGGYFWLWRGRLVGAGYLGPHPPVVESQRGLWTTTRFIFPALPRSPGAPQLPLCCTVCIILILIPTFVASCFFVRDQSYLVAPFNEYLLYTCCALANAEISRAQSLTWIMPTKS